MKLTRRNKLKIRNSLKRFSSFFMALVFLFQTIFPSQAWALTGGPSQPEVQSFEPIGTSDMVDLFSGDFNYNIPLLDVDGYPINIAYHSGIGMDQEASWVGLGWNINPGVITRNMRGLPDDFNGDVITKELNIKPNKTWGVAADLNIEVYGYEGSKGSPQEGNSGSVTLGVSFGFNYNNYTGPSINQGVNLGLSAASQVGGLNAGLGINSSSDDGLSIQPSAGFSLNVKNSDNMSASIGGNIGTSFNSRGGLKQLSINANVRATGSVTEKKTVSDGAGGNITYKNAITSMGGNAGTGGTFDFGTPTSTPQITNNFKNNSFYYKTSLGGEVFGVNGKIGVSGMFSSQKLAQTTSTNPAYGYLYSQEGQNNDNALMDFNREKDGAYNENMAALPVTNYTFDTYGVAGQGIGGSYRPFRSEVGYVYDPSGYTTSDALNIVTECGVGNLVKLGTDIAVTDVNGYSGKWKNNNDGIGKLAFTSKGKGNDYENVYFKEANEKTVDDDPAYYAGAGYDNPVSPNIDFSDPYEPVCKAFGPVVRKKRDKRTQNFYYLNKGEYQDYAIKPEANVYPAPSSHIAEVTTLATDGSRYVYGIAAYNTYQKEVTFSVGSTNSMSVASDLQSNNGTAGEKLEATEGLINYSTGDNSTGNLKGIDNFYSGTTTPAFAHSYLLTAVLSADYIDNDGERGPSDKDYGNYTRFVYNKYDGYNWRVPFDNATFNEGLKSDKQDDKANYIYGTKELWYLDSVVTKNYVAKFHTSPRLDGVGVNNENGGFGANSKPMYKLDSISLYSKADVRANGAAAIPIKRVHFEYTYQLCKNIPNAVGGASSTKGKLTLKRLYFSYQKSNKARLSPYIFDYHETVAAENPDYNIKAYDRWGNYKPNNAASIGVRGQSDILNFVSGNLPASDFPYVEQNQATADIYSSAWSLKEIQLPSGGKIKVNYESDDYAFVQNKQAMQMFNVVNIDNPSDASNTALAFRNDGEDKFYFNLQKDHTGSYITDINKYINGISNLYFRFLVKIRRSADLNYDHYEYVSGYGEIDPAKCGVSGNFGFVGFKKVLLEEKRPELALVNPRLNPIIRTAIQYARIYLAKKAYSKDVSSLSQGDGIESSSSFGTSVINALIGSDFTSNIKDAILGPNASLYGHPYHVGKEFVSNKSWVRLLNPNNKKLGGGCRVKKIEMSDEWQTMINGTASETTSYGQEYDYTLTDHTSSGVATYEPQLGGDENPFRQPLPYEIKKCMVPNDQFYQEEPFGESFFPTPSVGYSKVTVKNLSRPGVTRHATGKVVHEFYTSKDFPTITKRSDVEHVRAKDKPFSLASLLKIDVRDYLTAAQGFVVELNDMHGKPKSQAVYQEGQTDAISSVTYKYKQQNLSNGYKLNNTCTTIKKDGTVSTNRIGEFFDMVADFREEKTTTKNISVGINVDISLYGVYPVVVPTAWPSYAKQQTRYRSATTTKVIQRFGILDETIAKDLGSVVSTKNLAYDAETGAVLVTETTTNFNDKVYSLKYPAWWSYEAMGPAYQNIGFEMNNVLFTSGNSNVGSAVSYFREGDEIALSGTTNTMGWVKTISGNAIEVINKAGDPISGTYNLKIVRSGNRNTMTTDMATITTLTNPISSISSNIYQNVLQAGAVEFSNKRQTDCDCIGSVGSGLPATSNPYINGTRGNWRPLKSYTHLTPRSQSNYDNNTNIRKDGIFVSYSPFYKNTAGKWVMDGKDWTYVSEVTEFNVLGEELENKDALGRYSSASFGYNQSMALSVAANSRYQEQGFDGFEDYEFNPCVDDHFKFIGEIPTSSESHSGKYSLKIPGGSSKTLTKQIAVNCVPYADCNILINAVAAGTTSYSVSFSNSTDPVSVSWNIISGNPVIIPNSTGGFQINGSGYQLEILVLDSKGCSSSKIITN